MKKLSFFVLLCAVMALSIGCQKEAGVAAPEQPATKAITKCDADCPYCQHKDGKCTCLFCNCTRYCKTCGNEIYPLNHCVCGSGGGGNTGGDTPSHDSHCGGCGLSSLHCVCNKPALTTYPIEYMDKSKFVGAAIPNTQSAAYAVMERYRQERYAWPGYEVSGIKVTDAAAAYNARQYIDEQLDKYRQPVIAKIRCLSDDMPRPVEFWVAITGTGGPNTYYTYMELTIQDEHYRDMACDTEANRFTVDDPMNPILRDKTGRHMPGSTYEVIDVL